MLTEVYCEIDNICKQIQQQFNKKVLIGSSKSRNRIRMTHSEILTISILFHFSKYKTFKDYYLYYVEKDLKSAFPNLVSYTRFVELKGICSGLLTLVSQALLGKNTGISIIDSTTLEACGIKRGYNHKVLKGIAKKGKSSMGWFFGTKLHLVINHLGEIVSTMLTSGNISDGNKNIVNVLTKNISGKLVADKGYIGNFQSLFQRGITLIHGIRINMKNKFMHLFDKFLLRKRSIIETVNGILKESLSLEHARHRSVNGFIAHIFSTVSAYSFYKNKPMIKLSKKEALSLVI